MMGDIKSATTCCLHLTNALGKVYDTIKSIDEEDIETLHAAIKKLFGTMPGLTSEWTNNLRT
jgi:hypothetical protein